MKNLKKNIHKITKEYNSYIITVIVISIFEVFKIITSFFENEDGETLSKSIEYILEIIFFIAIYIIIDLIVKRAKKFNKYLQFLLTIIVAATLCSIIEINFKFFFTSDLSHVVSLNNKLDILSSIFIEEFIEVFILLNIAYFVQHITYKFLLSNFSLESSGFISKIPEHQRKNIYMIKSKENYIDVYYGENGQHKLINYRFYNALQEIDPKLGMQIHRSYWIENSALKTLKKSGQKNFVTAKNGEEIPVSKTYIKIVKNQY